MLIITIIVSYSTIILQYDGDDGDYSDNDDMRYDHDDGGHVVDDACPLTAASRR